MWKLSHLYVVTVTYPVEYNKWVVKSNRKVRKHLGYYYNELLLYNTIIEFYFWFLSHFDACLKVWALYMDGFVIQPIQSFAHCWFKHTTILRYSVGQRPLQIGYVPHFKELIVDQAPKNVVHFLNCNHQSYKLMRLLLLLVLYQKPLKKKINGGREAVSLLSPSVAHGSISGN